MAKQKKQLTLLFLRNDNQVLLAMKKRGFGANRWNGVGGKVEAEESIEDAMIRETGEEISVRPLYFEKVAYLTFDEFFKNQPTLMYVHVFVSDHWEGVPTESEEMRPQWFAADTVPYSEMWPDDQFWLPQVLEGKKIVANFTLDKDDIIIKHQVDTVAELLTT